MGGGQPRLLDQVRDRIRRKHYGIRTEQAYVDWIRRFVLHHNKRHPRTWVSLCARSRFIVPGGDDAFDPKASLRWTADTHPVTAGEAHAGLGWPGQAATAHSRRNASPQRCSTTTATWKVVGISVAIVKTTPTWSLRIGASVAHTNVASTSACAT